VSAVGSGVPPFRPTLERLAGARGVCVWRRGGSGVKQGVAGFARYTPCGVVWRERVYVVLRQDVGMSSRERWCMSPE